MAAVFIASAYDFEWALSHECYLNRWASRKQHWRLSDQDRSTIDYQGLASAEFFLHQEQIGLRYIMGFANSANWKTVAHAFIQAFPFWRSHVLPEVRPNHSRRHRIYTYRRQLEGQGARQGLDCSADTRSNHPSFMWSLSGNSSGEHDRPALSNILASVFNSG